MWLNDNRVCRGCGRMGVTRHTCPSCPCNYCKKDGHIADNCTRALPHLPLSLTFISRNLCTARISINFIISIARLQPMRSSSLAQPQEAVSVICGFGICKAPALKGYSIALTFGTFRMGNWVLWHSHSTIRGLRRWEEGKDVIEVGTDRVTSAGQASGYLRLRWSVRNSIISTF